MSGGRSERPEFRWVWARGRTRLWRLRRLVLPFEIRREEGARVAELWIRAGRRHHRWRLAADALSRLTPPPRLLAAELRPLGVAQEPGWSSAPWDRGVCELVEGDDAAGIDPFQTALARGELLLRLQGRRVRGGFSFERTALAVDGEAQWVIRPCELPAPVRETR